MYAQIHRVRNIKSYNFYLRCFGNWVVALSSFSKYWVRRFFTCSMASTRFPAASLQNMLWFWDWILLSFFLSIWRRILNYTNLQISSFMCFGFFFLQILATTHLSFTYLSCLDVVGNSRYYLHAVFFSSIVYWYSPWNCSFLFRHDSCWMDFSASWCRFSVRRVCSLNASTYCDTIFSFRSSSISNLIAATFLNEDLINLLVRFV